MKARRRSSPSRRRSSRSSSLSRRTSSRSQHRSLLMALTRRAKDLMSLHPPLPAPGKSAASRCLACASALLSA